MFQRLKNIKITSDKVIWILIMLFAMISVLAVFSTSTYRANANGVSKITYFFEQMQNVGLGLATLLLCYFIPLKVYRRLSIPIYILSVVLLVLALVNGQTVNGANRGLVVAGHVIQVLEFAKIGLIFYLAKALETWGDDIHTLKDFIFRLLIPIALTCVCVIPNSASTVVLLGLLSLLTMFFMGIDFKYLAFTIGLAVAGLALIFLIYNAAFSDTSKEDGRELEGIEKIFARVGTAQNRILNFKEEFKDEETEVSAIKYDKLTAEEKEKIDKNRQSENAKIAISEGGIFGKGPGKSTQRFTLSEAFSDFIYASIVEEYGLLGGIFIIFLYSIFIFRCIRLCLQCQTAFTQTLVIGLSCLIALQAMLHIFVNVRLIPITGHTLPLISQGGNAFIILSGAFGVLLSVSRHVNEQAAQTDGKQGNSDTIVEEEDNE